MNYKDLSYDELKKLSWEELYEIPQEWLMENAFDIFVEKFCKIDDSSICLDDCITELTFDVYPLKNGKKINIYLIKEGDKFFDAPKTSATHYLEQIFDDKNNIVNEKIIKNKN